MFKFKLLRISVIVLLSILSITAWGKSAAQLWKAYQAAGLPEKRVGLLLEIAKLYEHDSKDKQADSIYDNAVVIAQLSDNDTLLLNAYKAYFSQPYLLNSPKAHEYAKSFINIATKHAENDWLYHAFVSSAKYYLQEGDTRSALDYINKAYYYAGLSNDDILKIECFLVWGKCLENTDNKIDAFRNYLNAQYLAQKQKNNELLFQCYEHLSFFYLLIGNYERARDYKIKQFSLLSEPGKPADSLQTMNLMVELAKCYYFNNERMNAEKINNDVILYAYAHNEQHLLNEAFDNHKTYLSSNGLYKELAAFYTRQYPAELKKLAVSDTIAWYRVMAYIKEEQNEPDSARYYFQEAEQMILATKADEKIYVSNFMKRYAQYLLRTGNKIAAKEKMTASYLYAKEAGYLPYMIETTASLDSMSYNDGQVALAYEYSKLNKAYIKNQENSTRQDAMLLMEIDNETRQRELFAEQEKEEIEHRHKVQYTGITLAIVICFIILIMLGVFKVRPRVIKFTGFFSFIFFFEFITLLLDHKIMHLTHGEPWMMLGIKIVLIAIMLPFHHWIEHRVIHYLIERKLVDPSRLSPRKLFNHAPEIRIEE